MPQLVTAGATLGGVVLTLVFTGRREERRTMQLLAFEREKLVLASLRDASVRYQSLVDEILPLYWDRQRGLKVKEADIDDAWKQLFTVGVEITLAVPILRVPVAGFEQKLQAINVLHLERVDQKKKVADREFDELLTAAEEDRVFLIECMTVALGTYDVGKDTQIEQELKKLYDKRALDQALEEQRIAVHTQPQLNEAPKSGDSNNPGPAT